MRLTHSVTMEESGTALLRILRGPMGLSASAVKRLKAYDALTVNGVSRYTDYVVEPGDLVAADISAAEADGDSQPELGPLSILYEDEGLLAVNKPPGMLVHPSRSRYTGTLSNLVAGYLQAGGQRPICHAVNRLDRDTSGVVLFAKNAHMKALAAAALQKPEAQKWYTALVLGVPAQRQGTISLPIRRERPLDMRRIVAQDGQYAVTHYTVVGRTETFSALHLRLETGRTHQIRVHCLASGFPLLGDGLYTTDESKGRSEALGISRQLLHSHELRFVHPLTGQALCLRAPVEDGKMAALLDLAAKRTEESPA